MGIPNPLKILLVFLFVFSGNSQLGMQCIFVNFLKVKYQVVSFQLYHNKFIVGDEVCINVGHTMQMNYCFLHAIFKIRQTVTALKRPNLKQEYTLEII